MRRPVLLLSLVLPLLAACQSPPVEATATETGKMAAMDAPILNTMCPMMPSMEIDPEETVNYGAGRVAFCCGGCEGKWMALSDAEKAEALARVQR